MRSGIRVLPKTLVTVTAAIIALAALRSDNRLAEAAGAVLVVVLAGWMIVSLLRARKRFVK